MTVFRLFTGDYIFQKKFFWHLIKQSLINKYLNVRLHYKIKLRSWLIHTSRWESTKFFKLFLDIGIIDAGPIISIGT